MMLRRLVSHLVIGCLLVDAAQASERRLHVCDDICAIMSPLPCDVVIEMNNFSGDCCSLTDIPALEGGGCTIQVSSGSCAWEPKDGSDAGSEYASASVHPCPATKYRVLQKETDIPSDAPSLMPSFAPSSIPSDGPSLMPSGVGEPERAAPTPTFVTPKPDPDTTTAPTDDSSDDSAANTLSSTVILLSQVIGALFVLPMIV